MFLRELYLYVPVNSRQAALMPSGLPGSEDPPLETERNQTRVVRQTKLGLPSRTLEEARSNRVATFMTNSELAKLEQAAWEEERSLAGVVHRTARVINRRRRKW